MALRTINTLPLHPWARVLVRCDFNVPIRDRAIADDGRIRAALPTIADLRRRGARVIACSHLGRPRGQVVPELSLGPVADRLAELLGTRVPLLPVGQAERQSAAASDELLLLENLRFDPGETSPDDGERRAFAERLAALADVVVSDGFGAMHRRQASTYELERLRPSAAGRLVVGELQALGKLLKEPARPYTVVLGGSKVSDKLGVIANLLPRVDRLVIGGGMAFTFLAALGNPVGRSLCETERFDDCLGILRQAQADGTQVVLPVDVRVAEAARPDADVTVVPATDIESAPLQAQAMGLDIGPDTEQLFAAAIADSATVFWNGPMGVFELPPFASGTRAVAAALRDCAGYTVVGGGDSASAVRTLGFADADYSHISTGGGASLELLEGKELPGLTVLGWSS